MGAHSRKGRRRGLEMHPAFREVRLFPIGRVSIAAGIVACFGGAALASIGPPVAGYSPVPLAAPPSLELPAPSVGPELGGSPVLAAPVEPRTPPLVLTPSLSGGRWTRDPVVEVAQRREVPEPVRVEPRRVVVREERRDDDKDEDRGDRKGRAERHDRDRDDDGDRHRRWRHRDHDGDRDGRDRPREHEDRDRGDRDHGKDQDERGGKGKDHGDRDSGRDKGEGRDGRDAKDD